MAPRSTSAAPRGNGLSLVVVADLPEKCRHIGKLADSAIQSQALSARITLASCLAEERVKPIVLCDCEQSVRDLEAASTQSLALLDEVAQIGDPATKVLALQVQGNLLSSFATRVLATVPQPVDASEAARTLRETRLSLIYPHVLPLMQRARTAYQLLETIARGNPKLAKNPAVVAAVRSSRANLATLAPQIAAATASMPAPASEESAPTVTASATQAPTSEVATPATEPTAPPPAPTPAPPAQTATR